ncbi:Biofilm and cell wall regulator 1 [Vanrija pseudolonga]|uniref:Biofilm and cell wall regulator 1 n=1 Tax=Vanrija pseudolonga TaxID=143232 RepID=A0AAF0Y5S1_9TREE|nr:Biofilm and cell wall regulator 1 [Vanrija pseudolonga]
MSSTTTTHYSNFAHPTRASVILLVPALIRLAPQQLLYAFRIRAPSRDQRRHFMSLTTTAPLSLPPHPTDRVHPSMSYPPTDDRAYQGYYSRPAPGSAHGPPAPDASSPERLHSAGGPYPKAIPPHGVPPQSPSHAYPPQDIGPAPGSSHGYPPQQPITPLSGSAGYPPQAPPQPYYGVAGAGQDPSLPSPPAGPGSRPGTAGYTQEGAPIVPVGISGGKMFRCRGFGECDKVFTRSEHLARHVRKHTGERPFPCHCGKAFSRLDNLRQHAATVHADQTQLNEAMLTSLASVHAALSQRANREQRRRGEVVEVPKNAVERPRGDRNSKNPPTGPVQIPPGGIYNSGPGYHQPHGGWAPPPEHGGRPRTAGSWVEYPRPPSSAGGHPYPAGYYEQGPPPSSHGRPPTANAPPGTAGSDDSSQVAYPYRPVSSNGPGVPQAGNWTSPPTPHAGYPPSDPSLYPQGSVPPPDGQHPYPPEHAQGGAGYGPPPPGSSGGYYYPAQQGGQGYYGQQSPAQQHPATFSSVPPPAGGAAPAQSYPPNYNGQASDSPFQYNAPPGGSYPYPPGGYDQRKRRSDDDSADARKHPRASNEAAPSAISALLGSPQQEQRSRPSTGEMPPGGQPPAGYPYYQDDRAGGGVPGGIRGGGGDRPGDRKPKALVAE